MRYIGDSACGDVSATNHAVISHNNTQQYTMTIDVEDVKLVGEAIYRGVRTIAEA
jgi:hypothetical protein